MVRTSSIIMPSGGLGLRVSLGDEKVPCFVVFSVCPETVLASVDKGRFLLVTQTFNFVSASYLAPP